MERDGYYITTGICLVVGLLFLVTYIIPTAKRLQGLFAGLSVCVNLCRRLTTCLSAPRTGLPLSKWRVAIT
jgi:hypothetical protein